MHAKPWVGMPPKSQEARTLLGSKGVPDFSFFWGRCLLALYEALYSLGGVASDPNWQVQASGRGCLRQPDEVVIFEGTFSWWAAWCMMIWVPLQQESPSFTVPCCVFSPHKTEQIHGPFKHSFFFDGRFRSAGRPLRCCASSPAPCLGRAFFFSLHPAQTEQPRQVLMILSTRGSAFQIISEEISYVKDLRPRN